MLTNLKVSLASLKEEKTLKIDDEISSDFLIGTEESDLKFTPFIKIKGHAYMAGEELIFNFNASTAAILPCAVCNEMTQITLEVKNAYHTVDTQDSKNAMVDLAEGIREILLLELPSYVECNDNNCPKRVELKKYFHNPDEKKTEETKNQFTKFFTKNNDKEK